MRVIKLFIVIILQMLAKGIAAQEPIEVFIPAGKTVYEVFSPEKIYQHPQFSRGKVLYRNNTETEALLNYNYLSGDIEFIGPKNDTLVISKELISTIKKIDVNGHTYLNNGVYVEQVEESALGKLLKRQKFVVINREKIGAYNQATSLGAIGTVGNMTDNNTFSRRLKVNENITMALETIYFFSDQFDNFLPATKKDIIKTYPSKKRQIEDYLKQHRVDLRNVVDLKKFFSSL